MIIKSVNIKNFRSIKDITIPIQTYGIGLNKSNTTFLVGVNESGKSAILDAISLINDGFSEIDYEDNCYIEAQENNEYIDIFTEIDLEIAHLSFWRKQIIEKAKIDEDFVNKINFNSLIKNTYRDKDDFGIVYELKINDDLPFYQYIVITTSKTVNGKIQNVESIEKLSIVNSIQEKITEQNAKSFLLDNQKILTKSKLEEIIVKAIKTVLDFNMPKIQIWKSSPKYLINDIVDLSEFKENPNISVPLKNIFHIYGKTKDEDIKNAIERALSNQARCDELQEKMSEKVTKYINKIWKEHKIKIRISINSNNCEVHVEDKDKKFAYYKMNQRSDGFKQFISLILSLSVQNETNSLNNNLILIDEPEVHLHPSGVRYLREEILKIGQKNNVIVSTHSHYMIDTNTPERHWIVQKEKSESNISQITHETNITDDNVIAAAFGLNLFKELLPQNIIIVEGEDDKNIISHSIRLLNNSFFYSIKSAGGASKAPGFARLLNEEKINAFILLDSDKEGRDNRKRILDEQGDIYSNKNVFTLKDILNTLPQESTIEDLLPIEFAKEFFEQEMSQEFTLSEDKAIIIQLKNQCEILKSNKQKLDSLKMKLSVEFCKAYDTKDKIDKIDRLEKLTNSLINKIEQFQLTD